MRLAASTITKRLNLLPARCAQYGRFFYAAYVAPAPHLHLKFEPRLTDSLIQAHGRPRPNLVGYSFCFLWAGAIGSGWQVRPYFSATDGPLQGKYTEGFYWGSASLLCEHSSCRTDARLFLDAAARLRFRNGRARSTMQRSLAPTPIDSVRTLLEVIRCASYWNGIVIPTKPRRTVSFIFSRGKQSEYAMNKQSCLNSNPRRSQSHRSNTARIVPKHLKTDTC